MTNPESIDNKGWFEKVSTLLEKNILGVKLGIYGVAFCGLGIALRSVRPFKKFSSPSEIPHSFFESQIKLNGTVTHIDFTSKPLLVVDHNPIFLKKFRSQKSLLVNIEGIDITSNGICWLQTVIVGSHIQFILLQKKSNYISCMVFQKNRNIGNHLISLGFASVGPYNFDLSSTDTYLKYYKSLLKEEDRAQTKGEGMWEENGKSSWLSFLFPLKLTLNR